MKQNKFMRFIFLIVICLLYVSLIACKSENSNKKTDENDESNIIVATDTPEPLETSNITVDTLNTDFADAKDITETTDKNTIVWAFPESYHNAMYNSEETAIRLNQKLKDDGYTYKVRFIYIDDMKYNSLVKDCDADIVFTGMRMEGEMLPPAYKAIAEGKYLNLDEYLDGSALYDFFPEQVWKSAEYKGSHYCIPNMNEVDMGLTLLIRKSDFTREQLDGFDGTFEGLISMLGTDKKIFYNGDVFSMSDMYGIVSCGYGLTKENGKWRNLLDYKAIRNSLILINRLERQGRIVISDDCMDCSDEWSAALFLTKTGREYGDDFFRKDYKRGGREHFLDSLAIRENSHNPQGAFELVQLIITNPEYGNLIVNGDCAEVVNGWAYGENGRLDYNYAVRLFWALNTGVYRGDGDDYTFDTPERCKEYYDGYIYAVDLSFMEDEDIYNRLFSLKTNFSRIYRESEDVETLIDEWSKNLDELILMLETKDKDK